MWPSIIGAGASLLGGLFGASSEKKAIARQNEYNNPTNLRARAESAGFNPLLFVGPGVGQQTATGGSNYMGSAMADAGLIIADGLAKKAEKTSALTKLAEENKRLVDKVNNLTLRPKVGGIYAQNVSTPSARQALGVPNESSVRVLPVSVGSNSPVAGGSPSPVRPLSHNLPIDTRRKVENDPVKTHSGFMVVDNPNLPFQLYAPTMDGDEQLEWYQYPSLMVPAAIGAAVSAFRKPLGPDGKIGVPVSDADFRSGVRPKAKPAKPKPKYSTKTARDAARRMGAFP